MKNNCNYISWKTFSYVNFHIRQYELIIWQVSKNEQIISILDSYKLIIWQMSKIEQIILYSAQLYADKKIHNEQCGQFIDHL